jgi:hypothetical protein
MNPSPLKYFAWISLVLLILVSCRSSRIYTSGEQAELIRNSILMHAFEKLTFKAKITFQERELSGLMLIKNAGSGDYKIAFFNEIGMTYIEGELNRKSKHSKFSVNAIAPVINYKSFVKNFEKCLQEVFDHAPMPPCPHADNETTLYVQLRNGFRLELSHQ